MRVLLRTRLFATGIMHYCSESWPRFEPMCPSLMMWSNCAGKVLLRRLNPLRFDWIERRFKSLLHAKQEPRVSCGPRAASRDRVATWTLLRRTSSSGQFNFNFLGSGIKLRNSKSAHLTRTNFLRLGRLRDHAGLPTRREHRA